MLGSNELERADLLEMAHLASALKRTIRSFEAEKKLTNHREILERGKQFVGCVMAGSLFSPREEVHRLLPEGAGLYESVRAYGYARRTWASSTPSVRPKCGTTVSTAPRRFWRRWAATTRR